MRGANATRHAGAICRRLRRSERRGARRRAEWRSRRGASKGCAKRETVIEQTNRDRRSDPCSDANRLAAHPRLVAVEVDAIPAPFAGKPGLTGRRSAAIRRLRRPRAGSSPDDCGACTIRRRCRGSNENGAARFRDGDGARPGDTANLYRSFASGVALGLEHRQVHRLAGAAAGPEDELERLEVVLAGAERGVDDGAALRVARLGAAR